MVAVPLTGMTLPGPVASSGSISLAYPAGFTQASFTGTAANPVGEVVVNGNDLYFEAEDEVVFTYGDAAISIQNLTGQTWPTGAAVAASAAYRVPTVSDVDAGNTGWEEIDQAIDNDDVFEDAGEYPTYALARRETSPGVFEDGAILLAEGATLEGEPTGAPTATTPAAGVLTLNFTSGNVYATVDANVTEVAITADSLALYATRTVWLLASGGARTITGWPAAWLLPSFADPTLSIASGKVVTCEIYRASETVFHVTIGNELA